MKSVEAWACTLCTLTRFMRKPYIPKQRGTLSGRRHKSLPFDVELIMSRCTMRPSAQKLVWHHWLSAVEKISRNHQNPNSDSEKKKMVKDLKSHCRHLNSGWCFCCEVLKRIRVTKNPSSSTGTLLSFVHVFFFQTNPRGQRTHPAARPDGWFASFLQPQPTEQNSVFLCWHPE